MGDDEWIPVLARGVSRRQKLEACSVKDGNIWNHPGKWVEDRSRRHQLW